MINPVVISPLSKSGPQAMKAAAEYISRLELGSLWIVVI